MKKKKQAYLYAIHENAKETSADEKFEKKTNPNGLPLMALMDNLFQQLFSFQDIYLHGGLSYHIHNILN